jgi:transposase-like protein
MGHTLAVFKKNLEQINAVTKDDTEKIELVMKLVNQCPQCKKSFYVEMKEKEIEKLHTIKCEDCQKAWSKKDWF